MSFLLEFLTVCQVEWRPTKSYRYLGFRRLSIFPCSDDVRVGEAKRGVPPFSALAESCATDAFYSRRKDHNVALLFCSVITQCRPSMLKLGFRHSGTVICD